MRVSYCHRESPSEKHTKALDSRPVSCLDGDGEPAFRVEDVYVTANDMT